GLVGLSPAVIEQGSLYAKVMFASCGFIIIRIALNGILRGAGSASMAMRTLWLSNALNILLCPLLIFGWGPVPAFGLLGVGIATAVARFIGVCYQAFHLVKGTTIIQIGKEQL